MANVTDFEELFELFFDEAFIDRGEHFLEKRLGFSRFTRMYFIHSYVAFSQMLFAVAR